MYESFWCRVRLSLLVICLLGLGMWAFTGAQPPKTPPPESLAAFTMNGTVPIEYFYVDDTLQGGSTHYVYSLQDIEKMIQRARTLLRRYESRVLQLQLNDPLRDPLLALHVPPAHWLHVSLLRYRELIAGGRLCVVGSSSPWVEAVALALGAESVVVLEYNDLTYAHPAIQTLTGGEMMA
ncbi:hypothetical protein EON64_18670, partial [archaeon]